MRKKSPWHEPADDDVIDGGVLAVTDAAEPDLADMDRAHARVASNELADALLQIALLDPEQSATRH